MLTTYVVCKVNKTSLTLDEGDLLIGYSMAYGTLPVIDRRKDNNILIRDMSHFITMTFNPQSNSIIFDIDKPPDDIERELFFIERFVASLGGGIVNISSEFDEKPLYEEKAIGAVSQDGKTFEEIFETNADDLEKFLERPFDDKSFMTDMGIDWTYDIQTRFKAVVDIIDDWFISSFPINISIKYIKNRYVLENLALFCIAAKGAKDLDDIKQNIQPYSCAYGDFITKKYGNDSDTVKAMKSGTANILKIGNTK